MSILKTLFSTLHFLLVGRCFRQLIKAVTTSGNWHITEAWQKERLAIYHHSSRL